MQLVQMKERQIQGFVPVTGNPDLTHLKVAVYYSKGYWLSVTPVKREVQGDYIIETMTGFSGYRCHICAGDRFNRKTLTTLWKDVVEDETNNQGAVAQMMDRVKGEKSLQSA